MPWTLWTLSRHLGRLRTCRILVGGFVALLVYWEAMQLRGTNASLWIQATWPRWLAYAWILLEGLREPARHGSGPGPAHVLVQGGALSWRGLRLGWECLCLWALGELLVRVLAWPIGSAFHVEPLLLLANLCCWSSLLCWALLLTRCPLPRGAWIVLVLALWLALEWWSWSPAGNPSDPVRKGLPFLLGALGLVLCSEAFPAACRSRF